LNNYAVIDRTDTNYAEILHVIEMPGIIGRTAIFLMAAGGICLLFSIIGCCAAANYSRFTFLVVGCSLTDDV